MIHINAKDYIVCDACHVYFSRFGSPRSALEYKAR